MEESERSHGVYFSHVLPQTKRSCFSVLRTIYFPCLQQCFGGVGETQSKRETGSPNTQLQVLLTLELTDGDGGVTFCSDSLQKRKQRDSVESQVRAKQPPTLPTLPVT